MESYWFITHDPVLRTYLQCLHLTIVFNNKNRLEDKNYCLKDRKSAILQTREITAIFSKQLCFQGWKIIVEPENSTELKKTVKIETS